MLNDHTFAAPSGTGVGNRASASTMTLNGTILKSLMLLGLTVLFGAMGWQMAPEWFSASSGGLWWLIGYFLLIGLSIGAASNPDLALPAGLVYSVIMGFWMGAVSRVYDSMYEGIVTQALLASVSVFLACLVLYLIGAVRATPKLTRVVITATFGIFVMYMMSWILSIFGVDLYFWNEPTTTGILISVAICIVAALNLFLDFGVIEQGIERHAPASREWYAALGLLSTLVWLYVEVLRLLALLRGRN